MKRAAFALGLGIAAAGIAALLSTTPLARAFENQTYDARLARFAPLSDQKSSIAMVEINDSSLTALEGTFGRWPWPRVVHSGIIDFLARAGARVIVYDVLFIERDTRGDFAVGSDRMSGSRSDGALVESVRHAGNVILAAAASSEGLINPASQPDTSPPALPGVVYRPGPGFQERPVLELPFDDLKNAAAGVGHTVLIKDVDGSARRQLPFIEYHQTDVPSLGLAAALAAERVPADAVRPRAEQRAPSRRAHAAAARRAGAAGSAGRSAEAVEAIVAELPARGADAGRQDLDLPGVLVLRRAALRRSSVLRPDAADRPGGVSRQGRVRRHERGGTGGRASARRSAAPACRACRFRRRSPTACSSNRFIRRASRGSELALTFGVGLLVAFVATFLPVAWATAAVGLIAVALGLLADARGRRGIVGGRGDAGGGARLRALWRGRVAVLRRGPRQAPRQAAVRAVRVAGRHRSIDVESGAGPPRRRTARHDGAVLRHPRVHLCLRAAAPRRPSSPS